MTSFDDKVKEILTEEAALPPVVEEKWQAAMGSLGGAKQKRPRKSRALSTVLKTAGTLAAAFAVLVGISAVNPVFAEKIPFMNSIIGFFRQEPGPVYQGKVITDTNITEHLQSVAPKDSPVTEGLTIEEAYCDGKILAFSARLTLKENLPEAYTILEPELNFSVDENEETYHCDFTNRMLRIDENSYVGTFALDVGSLELPETFPLEVTIPFVKGVDPLTYVLDEPWTRDKSDTEVMEMYNQLSDYEKRQRVYGEKKEQFGLEGISVSAAINTESNLVKTYEVNQTKNGCTVENLTVSPAMTGFTVSYPENYYLQSITDDAGRALSSLRVGREERYYQPLIKGTKSLTFAFGDMEDVSVPPTAITVPVEGGFADARLSSLYERPEESEITYIPEPPAADENTLCQIPGSQIVALGEKAVFTPDSPGSQVQSGSQEVTIFNMQIFDSAEAAGILEDDLVEVPSDVEKQLKFVTFDVTVKNSKAESAFFDSYNISNFFLPSPLYYERPFNENNSDDPVYFADHSNGVKNYYEFALGTNEEFTTKVGVYLDEADLRAGNVQISMATNANQAVYVTLPPYGE